MTTHTFHGLARPDMDHRFGAFADVGPDATIAEYFATAEEATIAAREIWARLTDEERMGTDIYAGEINLHAVNGRLGWDTVTICYDAKDEARRAEVEA